MFPSLGQVTADSNLKMNLRISIFILFLLASSQPSLPLINTIEFIFNQ